MRSIDHLQILVLLELCLSLNSFRIGCELYASVEELSRWSLVGNKLIELLDASIRVEEDKLAKLYNIQKLFSKSNRQYGQTETRDGNASKVLATGASMEHPVEAFVSLNRFLRAIEALQSILDEIEFSLIKEKFNFPSSDDLIGCGEALLRLQKFYGLQIDDIVNGSFDGQSNSLGHIMGYNDCFELGKIAYEDSDYSMASQWFQKALELNDDGLTGVSELLEYMAFAAYKNNQIKYAYELTNMWLEKDPNNERALGNLEYYEEELGQDGKIETATLLGDDGTLSVPNSSIRATQTESYLDRYSVGKVFTSANYSFADDDIVKYLCTSGNEYISQNYCTKRISLSTNLVSPELKIEIISNNPTVVRIYDIITEEEASYLRHTASSRLERSTVQTKQGLVTSDFRIAKTAWLSSRSDQIVDRIERRIGEILNLDLNSSEDLQVVNYGIGGFYGPHLDSARETSPVLNNSSDSSGGAVQISSLMHNDRLATILIYLNRVKAGGATVFPKLNLTVRPIERSAVIWCNIMKSGYTDERTLHTGCPVLLGSKWIATKWPREAGNTFVRPSWFK